MGLWLIVRPVALWRAWRVSLPGMVCMVRLSHSLTVCAFLALAWWLVLFGACCPSRPCQCVNVNRDLHRYNIYNRYNVNIYRHLRARSAPVPRPFCSILCALVCILGLPGLPFLYPTPISRALYIYICYPTTSILNK